MTKATRFMLSLGTKEQPYGYFYGDENGAGPGIIKNRYEVVKCEIQYRYGGMLCTFYCKVFDFNPVEGSYSVFIYDSPRCRCAFCSAQIYHATDGELICVDNLKHNRSQMWHDGVYEMLRTLHYFVYRYIIDSDPIYFANGKIAKVWYAGITYATVIQLKKNQFTPFCETMQMIADALNRPDTS